MMSDIKERLRDAVQKLRRTPMAIADVAPMLQAASDHIANIEQESAANLQRALVAEKDGWIFTKDALPPEHEEYLTYGKDGFEVGMYYPAGHAISGSPGACWLDSKAYGLRGVTAWKRIVAPDTSTQDVG